jgi:hypothetical protein
MAGSLLLSPAPHLLHVDDGLSLDDILNGKTSKSLELESPDDILAEFGIQSKPAAPGKPGAPAAAKPSPPVAGKPTPTPPGRAQPVPGGQGAGAPGMARGRAAGPVGTPAPATSATPGRGTAPAATPGSPGIGRSAAANPGAPSSPGVVRPVATNAPAPAASPLARSASAAAPSAAATPAGGMSELQKPPACDLCRTPHPESSLTQVKHKKLVRRFSLFHICLISRSRRSLSHLCQTFSLPSAPTAIANTKRRRRGARRSPMPRLSLPPLALQLR